MANLHAYWIHHARKTESTVTGYIFLPKCDCSNCGYTSTMEKSVCPSCGAAMDRTAPKDAMVVEDDDKKEEKKEEEKK